MKHIIKTGVLAALITIEREWIDALERQRPDLIGGLGHRRDRINRET